MSFSRILVKFNLNPVHPTMVVKNFLIKTLISPKGFIINPQKKGNYSSPQAAFFKKSFPLLAKSEGSYAVLFNSLVFTFVIVKDKNLKEREKTIFTKFSLMKFYGHNKANYKLIN